MVKIDSRTKPCPFCGKKPFLLSVKLDDEKPFPKTGWISKTGWIIRCMTCGCNQMPFASEELALERWNKRAADDGG